MVKSALKIFVFLFLCINFAQAAQFSANVSPDQLAMGDTLVLELQLSEASPKGAPDLSDLVRSFTILSKQQLANTSIVNGQTSLTVSWQYLLTPKVEGTVTIPSIAIDSAVGRLHTSPLTILVKKGAAPRPVPASQPKAMQLSGKVSKTNPYKNEPLIYTLRLTSQESLGNIRLDGLSMKGAIVKTLGKPEVSEKLENGLPTTIIEVKVGITPVQPGRLVIPSFRMQGDHIVQDKAAVDAWMGRVADPFAFLQQFGNLGGLGFEKVEPFSLSTKEITLDVQKPSPLVSPWLPAESLKISEEIKGVESAKVGEPLTRTFTLVGKGVAAAHLPSLKDKQGPANLVKVYEDKPTSEENFKNDTLTSWREESYTLIPQRPGKLTLPALSIAWWNIKENKVDYATVPERMIDVAPGAVPSSAQSPNGEAENESHSSSSQDQSAGIPSPSTPEETDVRQEILFSPLIYRIGGVLLTLCIGIGIWAFRLKKKVAHLKQEQEKQEPRLEKSFPKSSSTRTKRGADFSEAKTVRELHQLLQTYGKDLWGTPQNASVEVLFTEARKHAPTVSEEEIAEIITLLNDALYGEEEGDLASLKEACQKIITAVESNKPKKVEKGKTTLPHLNPT